MLGPVIAPFTVYDPGYARSREFLSDQSFTNKDASQYSIAKDSWSLTSGLFVPGSAEVKIAQRFARAELRVRNWDESEFTCLVDLWNRESKWNHRAENVSSAENVLVWTPPSKARAENVSVWTPPSMWKTCPLTCCSCAVFLPRISPSLYSLFSTGSPNKTFFVFIDNIFCFY